MTGSISCLIVIWLVASYFLGRYSQGQRLHRHERASRLAKTIAVAVISLAVIVVVVNWGLQIEDPRTLRDFVIPVIGGALLGSYGGQLAVSARQRRARRWLLIGNAREIQIISEELNRLPPRQKASIDMISTETNRTFQEFLERDYEGVGISETAKIADPDIEKIVECRSKGLHVQDLVSWSEEYLQRVPPELFSSLWLTYAEGFQLQPGSWSWRLKRFGDVVVSIALIVTTSPIILLAAIAIKAEDGGPILYSQIRTGLYGKAYRIWKLRSMRVSAESGGATWASARDPRVTNTGRLIRRLRIDELPQLLSVVRGDMSLIGPRPERPEIEVMLEQNIDHYRIRHWVRPGLSGWAQVCFPYGASVNDSRIKLSHDLYYIRHSNIFLDLLITIKTIRLVAGGKDSEPKQRA